jgi:hypothetical protein
MVIHKKLKFRQYEYTPVYQRQLKSKLILSSSSYPKKYIEKEYTLKQRDIEISKEYEDRYIESKEPKEPKEPHRHTTDTYNFICKVSDRRIEHIFSFRTEVLNIYDNIMEIHNDKYPDHEVVSYEFKNTFTIEDKGFYHNDAVTERQKDFLINKGISRNELNFIPNKRIASKILSRN